MRECFGDLAEYEQNDPECERCSYEAKCSEIVRLRERDRQHRYSRPRDSRPTRKSVEEGYSATRPVKKPGTAAFGPAIQDNRIVYMKTLDRAPGESLWRHAVRSAMLMGVAEGLHEAAVQVRYSRFAGAVTDDKCVDSDDE